MMPKKVIPRLTMSRKRQRSSNAKHLNMKKAPPQPENAREEIFRPEEAPEEAEEAPRMLEPFVDPCGFKRHNFKRGGWISYHQDFVFTCSLERYRGPLCPELALSNGPTPPKKRKGKAPAALGDYAADITINGIGAGQLVLKRDSQLKARLYIPAEYCAFTNMDYVRCFLGYQCILVEDDDMLDKTTGLDAYRLMVATMELADIRGRVYMMLQGPESLVEPTLNDYMKFEPECVLDEGSNDSAYGEGQSSNSPISSTQSTPEPMEESGGHSNDYVGHQEDRVSEASGKISQPPMVRIPHNNLIDQMRQELEDNEEFLGFPNSSLTSDTFADQRASEQTSASAKTVSTMLKTHEINRLTGVSDPLGTSSSQGDNTRPGISARPIANVMPVLNPSPDDNVPLVANDLSEDNTPLVVNEPPITNDSSGANAPLVVDTPTIANGSSGAGASSDANAPLVASDSSVAEAPSSANLRPSDNAQLGDDASPRARPNDNTLPGVNAPTYADVRPVARIQPGVNVPPRPPTGEKTIEQWRKLAENDNVLRFYLNEIYLWSLVQSYRPEWKSFKKPVLPNGYPALPTPDEYHKSHGVLPENVTSKKKHNAKKTIARLLKKLYHND